MTRALAILSLIIAIGAGAANDHNKSPLLKITLDPAAPHPGQVVRISAKVNPEITSLALRYQVVDPGRYIEFKDAAFQRNWLTTNMTLEAQTKEARLFTVALPAELQTNRRLVRYAFTAQDAEGHTVKLPATTDSVPNYAYFVYDGIPAWTGAINPRSNAGQRTPVTFDASVMRRVQSYILLAKGQSVTNITWRERDHSKQYRYTGTLVVDGEVYDHVPMRARGGVWRFEMGKNMWKFDFPKGHRLRALDDYGRPYPVPWSKLNLRTCIQQGDYGYRGEQGMFEAVGFRLFNLAGVPAPLTHWLQLRIITEPTENPPDQYRGDFWGLYLAIEDVDGHFLQTHGLPDGNVYKMEGGTGIPSHLGEGAVTNRSDLHAFMQGYGRGYSGDGGGGGSFLSWLLSAPNANRSRAAVGGPPVEWWRAQLDLPSYFSYRSICECIHHYDIGMGKNYYYYLNPKDHHWEVFPWDIDLTWADTMFGDGNEPLKRPVLQYPEFQTEYRNRLRAIRDLLYNPEETGRLIDEYAAIIDDPTGRPSPVDADRAKWDYHPMMNSGAKGGMGLFYRISPTGDFRGMVQLMKNYVKRRGDWVDRFLLNDPQIPATPALTYTGAPGFPTDKLTFRSSAYRGTSAFAAMEWRLAEISPPTLLRGRPTAPGKYEITPLWESGELNTVKADISIPPNLVLSGHTYRARVRVKDATGRWSHWSAPIQFVAESKK